MAQQLVKISSAEGDAGTLRVQLATGQLADRLNMSLKWEIGTFCERHTNELLFLTVKRTILTGRQHLPVHLHFK